MIRSSQSYLTVLFTNNVRLTTPPVTQTRINYFSGITQTAPLFTCWTSTPTNTAHNVFHYDGISLLRIKVEYGSDGSLESRLYLSGAGSGDSGQYSCIMPGMEAVTPANINISITTGTS